MSDLRRKIRRVVAPIAFLGALGLLASQTCKSEMAQATLVVEVPAGTAEVELELLPANGKERLGFFRGRPLGDPPAARWPLSADAGEFDIAITLRDKTGSTRHDKRRVTLADRATVRIEIEAVDEAID